MSQHGKAPSPFIPLSFVGIALVVFPCVMLWMLVAHPPLFAVLHALVLGVFLNVALGLLYQFIPVVSMGVLRLPALAYAHLVLAACGTVLIVYGFATGAFSGVYAGGALQIAGLALECVVLYATVQGRVPPAAAASALLSLAWLVAALAIGTFMGIALSHGAALGSLPRIHALAGLGGFFGTMIVGVTLRLLRMFERVDRETQIPLADASANAGVIASLFGSWGALLLPVSLLPFAREIAGVIRERNPAYQRETLWYTIASACGAFAASLAFAFGNGLVAIVCALWLFIGTAEVGYLQRIVPFIWWIRRARHEGARNIPTLGEMNVSWLGRLVLLIWTLAGIGFALDPMSNVAAVFGLIAWVGLIAQVARPFLLKKRDAE